MKASSLPSDLQALLRAEAKSLQDRLHATSARLGTPSERADDFTTARDAAHRLRNVQMALAGIAALHPHAPARPAKRPLRIRRSRASAAVVRPGRS